MRILTATIPLFLVFALGTATAQVRQRVLLVDRSPLRVDARMRQQVLTNLQNGLETAGYTVDVRQRSGGGGPPGPSIESLLAEAKTHSEQFREQEALASIARAEQVFRSRFGKTVSVKPLIAVLLARAKLSSESGKKDDVQKALVRVLTLDPDQTLDPGIFPPPIIAIFNGLKPRMAQRASLQVVTMPGGQPVWVDGRPHGRAPATVALTPGEHFVAAGPQGATAGRAVQVRGDSRVTVAVRRRGKLTVQGARNIGQQAGADWVTTVRVVPLQGGQYQVRTTSIATRTVDVPRPLRSQSVVEAQLVWATSQLGVKLQGLLKRTAVRVAPGPGPGPVRPGQRDDGSVFKTWWFWTIVVAVVGGGTATAVVLTRDNDPGVRVTVQR